MTTSISPRRMSSDMTRTSAMWLVACDSSTVVRGVGRAASRWGWSPNTYQTLWQEVTVLLPVKSASWVESATQRNRVARLDQSPEGDAGCHSVQGFQTASFASS